MRPLSAPPRRAAPGPRDPSRLARRLQRLWRRRGVRRAVMLHLPALALAACGAWLAAAPDAQRAIRERAEAVRQALTTRPEFAIRRIEVDGADAAIQAEVLAALLDARGASSLSLDPAALRARVVSLGWVRDARVTLEAPEALRVWVDQRDAAAVWRRDGAPFLIDAQGAVIEPIFRRADHADLPLVLGPGAEAAVAEALTLHAAAGPLRQRLRGLVRIGNRRWNAVLSGPAPGEDIILMLPETGARATMAKAVGAHAAARLFDRDVAVVDLRRPTRPVVRPVQRARPTLTPAPGADAEAGAGADRDGGA